MSLGHTLYGNGAEKVFLSHGWFGGGEATFGPLLPYLDTQSYTYAVVDHRGYGLSKPLTGRYNMEEAASDILQLADALHWQNFHLVGHSMGGKIVQRAALLGGERVNSLVAITPVPACALPFDADTLGLFHAALSDQQARVNIVQHSTGNRLCAAWSAHMIQALAQQCDDHAYAGYLQSWIHDDFAEAMPGVKARCKVIAGALDPSLTLGLLTQTFGQYMNNVEYEVLENSGHYPCHELPVYLVSTLERFLGKQG